MGDQSSDDDDDDDGYKCAPGTVLCPDPGSQYALSPKTLP